MTISVSCRAAIWLVVAAALGAGSAAGQSPAAMEGLLQRPDGWQPVPEPRPGVAERIGSDCRAMPPELAFYSLSPSQRAASLEAMIGQLLVISFSGRTADAPGVDATVAALAASEIGGVLFFRHNVGTREDVIAINQRFATAHPKLPAMVAVDQEGGAVMRLKPSEGAPATPSAEAVASEPLALAEVHYRRLARALSELGFTANFGPVVDLAVNPNNPVVARFGRSFGADPAKVAEYSRVFIDAHDAEGVATALKHFPGHGSSSDDSHTGAIDLTSTWSRNELRPFEVLADASEHLMVMNGHLTLKGMTGPDGLPASLSPVAIEEVLRQTLCFEGVVVSDDLTMDAIESTWEPAEAIRLMIEAGGDVALISLPAGQGMAFVRGVIAEIAAAAREDRSLRMKIRNAYARVVHHKLDLKEVREARAGDTALVTR